MGIVKCRDCIYGDCFGGKNRSCVNFPSIGTIYAVSDDFFCVTKGKSKKDSNMFYFLTCTAKRKNARRHIVSIYDTLEEVINHPLLTTENPHQYYDLYNSKWELVKEGKR